MHTWAKYHILVVLSLHNVHQKFQTVVFGMLEKELLAFVYRPKKKIWSNGAKIVARLIDSCSHKFCNSHFWLQLLPYLVVVPEWSVNHIKFCSYSLTLCVFTISNGQLIRIENILISSKNLRIYRMEDSVLGSAQKEKVSNKAITGGSCWLCHGW